MSLFQKARAEFIDIIQWTEPPQSDILAYRFERYNNEIKMGAKLTVREGQTAVFVNEGKLADVYQPGMYTLSTENMPILATLKGWKYGFDSPFRAEVYFLATRQFTDLKWGTPNPVMMRDKEFGVVRIRAFGTYAMHISDATVFLRQQLATNPVFETSQVSDQIRDTIVARFTDALGQAQIPALELAGNYDKLSKAALEKIKPDLASLGLELTLFYVENISLPQEVEQAMDTRARMGVLGDMNQYTRYQAATAIPQAASNPGGVAGIGAGFGVGIGIGNQMASSMGAAVGAPPPVPKTDSYFLADNGAQSGPFDMAALSAKIKSGDVKPETLIWKNGMPAWIPAQNVDELKTIFPDQPPPLPK
ncbi:MAG TPA: SPFH domain-containing protein [Phycisphaerae bacterium]|nr:SPFH domain-containing protein [Phycisphaerae bacterium]